MLKRSRASQNPAIPSTAHFRCQRFNVVLRTHSVRLTLIFGVIAEPRPSAADLRFINTRMALPIAIQLENFARHVPTPFARPAVVVHHPETSEFSAARDQAATESVTP